MGHWLGRERESEREKERGGRDSARDRETKREREGEREKVYVVVCVCVCVWGGGGVEEEGPTEVIQCYLITISSERPMDWTKSRPRNRSNRIIKYRLHTQVAIAEQKWVTIDWSFICS